MTGESVSSVKDLVGEWRATQKLMFVFVQFTNFVFGVQSLELTFLMPKVDVYCESNSTVDACSGQCSRILYRHEDFGSTLTEELQLVCGRAWLQSFSTTVLMLGAMVSIFAGDLADRVGRKKTVLLSLVPFVLGALLVLFQRNYPMFISGVALTGMAFVPVANFSYLLLFELCGEKRSSMIGVSMAIGFNLGAVFLGGVAWALRHWFHVKIVSASLLVVLSLAWFLPESTEWLIQKGRKEEAVKTIKRIMRFNGEQKMDDSQIQLAVDNKFECTNASGKDVTLSWKHLFTMPEHRTRIICSCYFWFTTSFVFYGFTLNVKVFGDNLFLSFILSSASALPSILLVLLLLKFVHIKWIIVGCHALVSLVCYLYPLGHVVSGYKTASVVLGWFFTSPAIIMLYPFTSTLFPTEVRGKAIGLSTFSARVGGSLAPFAKEIGLYTKDYVPMLVFGCMCTLLVVLLVKLDSGRRQLVLQDTSRTRGRDNPVMFVSNDAVLVRASPHEARSQVSTIYMN